MLTVHSLTFTNFYSTVFSRVVELKHWHVKELVTIEKINATKFSMQTSHTSSKATLDRNLTIIQFYYSVTEQACTFWLQQYSKFRLILLFYFLNGG